MGTYTVSRTRTIAADRDRIHALLADFHEWRTWSPWEDLDPDLQRTYGGAERGPGSTYAWKGNRKAGEGRMEMTGSTPERVDVTLTFLKPFRSTSSVTFTLAPAGDADAATDVTWTMTGEQKGLMGVLGKVVSMDRLIGKDFDKGLERLRAAAEG